MGFNLSKNTINVVNTPNKTLKILDNRNYVFSINNDTITFSLIEYDYFYFFNGELFISDQPEADGHYWSFIETKKKSKSLRDIL